MALAIAASAPGCSSEPSHPPQLGDCVPVGDASCGSPTVGSSGGVGPHGDAAAEEDGEAGISDAGSCSSIASSYFQPASSECLPCIVSECCMSLVPCTTNLDCRQLLICAQTPCEAGTGASCLAVCEMMDTQAVVMDYQALAMCIDNCPACPGLLPVQPSDSDL